MVKKRLIISLLWQNSVLIQSINFRHTNAVGSVFTAMEFFNAWESDEIVLLNVTKYDSQFDNFIETLAELSKICFVPLTVGGWMNTIDRVEKVIENGADKVVVNTHAFRNPTFISSIAKKFGSQCAIVSIDAKKTCENEHEVFIDRGREGTEVGVVEWAVEAEKRGAGEILLTSIDNDGSKKGYDGDLIRKVTSAVGIPVIAFGGVGNWDHLVDGIAEFNADAVSAGNIFHYFEQSVRQAKRHLIKAGVDVRIPDNYMM